MAIINIRGHSDDIIICDGDLHEEFYPSNQGGYLGFSDGTLVRVMYDHEGCWRISRVVRGQGWFTITKIGDPDNDYSDHVTLQGDIRWVVFGERMERVKANG
jgi:hypothetical protein